MKVGSARRERRNAARAAGVLGMREGAVERKRKIDEEATASEWKVEKRHDNGPEIGAFKKHDQPLPWKESHATVEDELEIGEVMHRRDTNSNKAPRGIVVKRQAREESVVEVMSRMRRGSC